MKNILFKVVHLIQRFIHIVRDLPSLINEFGWKPLPWLVWDRLFLRPKSKGYIKAVYKYVNKFCQPLLSGINADYVYSEDVPKKELQKMPVWVCWFQGKENMPELVKVCYKQLCKNVSDSIAEVHLITKDNINEYVDIPVYITDKFNRKIISPAAYSDVFRFALTSVYGGVWVDATIYASSEIPIEFFKNDFYSMKMYPELCMHEACEGKWTGFLFGGRAENHLFKFVRDSLYLWWKKHNRVIDYVLFDYIITVAYKNLPDVRQAIDDVPYNNEFVWELKNVLNEKFDIDRYKQITDVNLFHKLAHQVMYQKITEDGDITFYGYICKEVL